MTSREEKQDLTTGNLFKKLLAFSIPLLFTGVLQLFFTTTDLLIVGKFGSGNNSLSAIGSCSTLLNLIVGSTIGLSAGLNIIVGNAKGEKDKDKIKRVIESCFVVALVIGLITGLFGFFMARRLLEWTSVDPIVIDKAESYLKVYFLGTPFIIIYNFAAALLRGYGDSKTPLIILTISGILNVGFNCVFVIPIKLDVTGVALGTVISQGIAAISTLIYLSKGKQVYVNYKFRETKLYLNETKEMLLLGVMAATQSLFFNISNIIISAQINKFGAAVTAGNTAASNIDGYIYLVMNAFSVANMAIVSQNYGARKFDRAKKSLLYSILSVTIVAGFLGVIFIIFRYPLLSILISEKGTLDLNEVYRAGSERVIVVSSIYFTCGIMECLCAYYRGLKFSVTPTIISLTGSVILRITFIYTLYQLPYFHTLVWLLSTYPISWIVTIGIYCALYPMYSRKAFSKNINWREDALKAQ